MPAADCPLCHPAAEEVLWQDELCRVIVAPQPGYPGLCRVIWNAHVKEMSDLSSRQRAHLMAAVFAVEEALRAVMKPVKVNLASLGNQVPHLHWHVIPRFGEDAHFPDPIWAAPRRDGVAHPVDREKLLRALQARLSP